MLTEWNSTVLCVQSILPFKTYRILTCWRSGPLRTPEHCTWDLPVLAVEHVLQCWPLDSSCPQASAAADNAWKCVIWATPACGQSPHYQVPTVLIVIKCWEIPWGKGTHPFQASGWLGAHARLLGSLVGWRRGNAPCAFLTLPWAHVAPMPMRKEESLPHTKTQFLFCLFWMEVGHSLPWVNPLPTLQGTFWMP